VFVFVVRTRRPSCMHDRSGSFLTVPRSSSL
jgi:hypothetical protein